MAEISGYEFNAWILVMFFILGAIGTLTNCISAIRVLRTFNIRDALYLVLFVDGCVVTCLLLLTTLTTMSFLMDLETFQSDIACHTLVAGSFGATFISPLFACQISLIR